MSINISGAPSQWQDYIAAPGTANGTRARNNFITQVLTICGGLDNIVLFWLPIGTETTTVTSLDRNARVFTEANTLAGRMSALGSGIAVADNGTSDYATTPDIAAGSFGDTANDSPFTVIGLDNITNTAAVRHLLSKNSTNGILVGTDAEWVVYIETDDSLKFRCFDASASGSIRLASGTPTAGAWHMWAVTYDGTRSEAGMAGYVDSAVQGRTLGNTTYTAMEPGTSAIAIGQSGGVTASQYGNGSRALRLLVSRQLSQDDIQALLYACNAYFNLALT